MSFSAKPATKDLLKKYNEPRKWISRGDLSAESTFRSRWEEWMDGVDKGFAKYGHSSSCV